MVSNLSSPDSSGEHAWSSYGLYQHTPEAVKEIVFGELMTAPDRQAILKIMTGRNVAYFKAVRDNSSFEINIQPFGGGPTAQVVEPS
jgi:hypothetical protein